MSMPNFLELVVAPPDSSLLYTGHYDPVLVALSIVVAVFASYASLLVSQHILVSAAGETRRLWVTVGGLCLGVGIWAMHFVGMLAFSLPCSSSYDAAVTSLSTIPGILAGILAIRVISRRVMSRAQLAGGGLLIGTGIAAMHYSGMAAMRLDGLIRYDARLFVLSIVVAVALATLALWSRFRLQAWQTRWNAGATIASAVVLGLAVSGMHYTAMAATYFIRDGDSAVVSSGITPAFLAAVVLVATSLIVVVTIVATYVGNRNLLSLRRSYRLIGTLVVGWGVVAWLSADYYHRQRADELYQQESQLASQQADQIASNMDEEIQRLKGVSVMVSRDQGTQRALRRFAADSSPSRLAHGVRKQRWTQDKTLDELNGSLLIAATHLKADDIFVLNVAGDCVAASNAYKPGSFVGTNYADREYFRQARAGQRGHQYAMGRVSKIPGLFYSAPVLETGHFLGVVVVKRDLTNFSRWTKPARGFLADSNGVIVLAADTQLEFRVLPDAPAAGFSSGKKLLQYKQSAFKPLGIASWGGGRFPSAVLFDGSNVPAVLASKILPEDAITIYVPRPLGDLARLGRERNWLFALLATTGSMLIIAAAAVVQYLRESRATAADLRIAATAFESQEGMAITNAERVILRVNQAFTDITGYTAAEAIGRSQSFLDSGRQDPAFYAAMWESIDRSGSWQGEIWNRRKNGEAYPEWLTITAVKGNNGIVTHYVGAFTDITARKTAEDEIKQLAFYDQLTQLPNRRLMLDRLAQALTSSARHGRHGALMLIDLDNFKTLNDTLGHAVGDQLLVEAALRLQSSIREGDTAARLGGDEFVVILEDLDQGQQAAVQAEGVATKILAKLGQQYRLDVTLDGEVPSKRSHHCTSSIGITLFRGHAVTVDELMKRADTAMYQAKAAGRNTLRFFDPETQAAVRARAALELDLRKAVVEGQFLLHYQAQVDSSGRVIGAEALVRWQHPERGLVSPAEFIPLAEDTGLIVPLGHQVLASACAQLAAWAARPDTAHLTLAVNVSARQFSLPNLVEQVLAVIDHTGAPPDRLKLELTESLLLENAEDVITKMIALKARGVGFSLDDFGTGYSSLSYLKRLPLDQLKIDQSFVRDILTDPNDAAIARTVVALGQSLGLAVIAEGVETEGQRDFLASSGCLAYQGYFFSRPLPVAGFEAYLNRGR